MDYGFVEPDFSGAHVALIRGNVVKLVSNNDKPKLSKAAEKRAEVILQKAAKAALDRIAREHKSREFEHYTKLREYVETAFDKALRYQCNKLISASNVKPSIQKAIDKIKILKAQGRKELANDLRKARRKLQLLEWEISHAEETSNRVVEEKAKEKRKTWALKLLSAKRRLQALKKAHEERSKFIASQHNAVLQQKGNPHGYPGVPIPTDSPQECVDALPSSAGIYFLWNGKTIEYVGQAKRLCDRVKLGSHHVLTEEHMVSFICVKLHELTWAECYYIGITRPMLNFGKMAAHNRYDT